MLRRQVEKEVRGPRRWVAPIRRSETEITRSAGSSGCRSCLPGRLARPGSRRSGIVFENDRAASSSVAAENALVVVRSKMQPFSQRPEDAVDDPVMVIGGRPGEEVVRQPEKYLVSSRMISFWSASSRADARFVGAATRTARPRRRNATTKEDVSQVKGGSGKMSARPAGHVVDGRGCSVIRRGDCDRLEDRRGSFSTSASPSATTTPPLLLAPRAAGRSGAVQRGAGTIRGKHQPASPAWPVLASASSTGCAASLGTLRVSRRHQMGSDRQAC